ncbi:MAG: hypothetical protein OEQ74_05075, partial [Gammaproteobacteria bacterium]|nr:hypothetical protein [Gammaproteobacteria bacterium]
ETEFDDLPPESQRQYKDMAYSELRDNTMKALASVIQCLRIINKLRKAGMYRDTVIVMKATTKIEKLLRTMIGFTIQP